MLPGFGIAAFSVVLAAQSRRLSYDMTIVVRHNNHAAPQREPGASEADVAVSKGVCHDAGRRAYAEFAHQVGAVSLHGLVTER